VIPVGDRRMGAVIGDHGGGEGSLRGMAMSQVVKPPPRPETRVTVGGDRDRAAEPIAAFHHVEAEPDQADCASRRSGFSAAP